MNGWRWPVLLVLLGLAPTLACLRDSDTLADERRALPSVYDAVFGTFPRRTREYYERRLKRLATTERTPASEDDRAVALARLGRLDPAIVTLKQADAQWPNRYQTWSNLATFQAMAEHLPQAVEASTKAVQLAPAAQSLGERYERLALRWELTVQREPAKAMRSTLLGFDFPERLGPDFRVTATIASDPRQRELDQRDILNRLQLEPDVYDGLADLIRQSPRELPEAYFVLGELLAARGDRRLAWHAYQRALDLEHPREADLPLYQQQVRNGLDPEERSALTTTQHWKKRRRVLDWLKAYQRFERQLIASGGDPDQADAYQPFYDKNPKP